MGTGMFVIRDDGHLVEMSAQPYDSEDVLQRLLAQYPNLLVGDQMSALSPRRWLLISRETGIPSAEGASDRWSLDHLFLDQDGIPTLVEVKRSSDTRIRREVVGQMLDYAANAVVYWPVETLRATFQTRCAAEGLDEAEVIEATLACNDADELWDHVRTNLQAHKVRMVFVADVIPPELRRIVEFLNEQMRPAEVLAIEIKQYLGEGLRTLVPRVIGQTAAAAQAKGVVASVHMGRWNEESFFADLATRHPQDIPPARAIYEWVKVNVDRLWWGQGKQDGSCYAILDYGKSEHLLLALWTSGHIEFPFQKMRVGPFADESRRLELVSRLNAIGTIALSPGKVNGLPMVRLSALTDQQAQDQLLDTLQWVVQTVRSS
ncbi:MAG: hypothetical protein ACRDHE_18315 [Ktedonobacterales bacterium]